MRLFILLQVVVILAVEGRVVDFEQDVGGIADDFSEEAAWFNGGLMNSTLPTLEPGDTFFVPNKTFYLMGGINAGDISSVVIVIDGTLLFSDDLSTWPRNGNGDVLMCLQLDRMSNVTWTSSGVGTLDGNGERWWGIPGIGFLVRQEDRPKLLVTVNSTNLLFENLFFKDSPRWTFLAKNVDSLEIRNCEIEARRSDADNHNIIDMTAFNTDGFDVTGRNVWIHDVSIWNQDDCIAVKDNYGSPSENMLFERINMSGVGATIGSIGCSIVNNITFRDIYMHHPYKGIYMKFRGCGACDPEDLNCIPGVDDVARISNVLYENIYIDQPSQFAIEIGPAQQYIINSTCSILWPWFDALDYVYCVGEKRSLYDNITLRNITIADPLLKFGQGVILGDEETPMTNVVFDGVRVIDAQDETVASYYKCEGVQGAVATGATYPVPQCFEDRTDPR